MEFLRHKNVRTMLFWGQQIYGVFIFIKETVWRTTFNFLKLHLKSHFSWWYYMSIIFHSFAILNNGLFTSLNVPQKISKIKQKINVQKPINDKKYSKFSHFSNTQQALLIIKDAFIVSKSQSTPSRHYHLTFVITCHLMMRPLNLRTCCQERGSFSGPGSFTIQ